MGRPITLCSLIDEPGARTEAFLLVHNTLRSTARDSRNGRPHILPALVGTPLPSKVVIVLFGIPNSGVLVTLKASVRNCS